MKIVEYNLEPSHPLYTEKTKVLYKILYHDREGLGRYTTKKRATEVLMRKMESENVA
jgi:hypothetical protein